MTITPGPYRHYKGGWYEVTAVARHSETGEELVVYRSATDGSWWARPAAMFSERVEHEGIDQPRFDWCGREFFSRKDRAEEAETA